MVTRQLLISAAPSITNRHSSGTNSSQNVSVDEAKLFDQCQNLFEFVQKEHQPNTIYGKMMEHDRWAKYFATCNTIECFSELIKIAQFYFSSMFFFANVD